MNYFSELEDRLIEGWLSLFPPKTDIDKKTVTLYFDFGLSLLFAAMIASTVTSAVQRRKSRKSQEKMAEEARKQQAKEAKAMADAEKKSRTPLAPKEQQLAVQARPTTATRSRGSLGIKSSKRGKSKLRIGSGSGSVGARYA